MRDAELEGGRFSRPEQTGHLRLWQGIPIQRCQAMDGAIFQNAKAVVAIEGILRAGTQRGLEPGIARHAAGVHGLHAVVEDRFLFTLQFLRSKGIELGALLRGEHTSVAIAVGDEVVRAAQRLRGEGGTLQGNEGGEVVLHLLVF